MGAYKCIDEQIANQAVNLMAGLIDEWESGLITGTDILLRLGDFLVAAAPMGGPANQELHPTDQY